MERPRLEGIKAPAWWRLLLVLTYNTGLRRRTLFSLRMEHINCYASELVMPAKLFKTRRGMVLPLGPVVTEHLLATRTDREMVLPFPHDMAMFYRLFNHLQYFAAIPEARRFSCTRFGERRPRRCGAIRPTPRN